MFYDTAAINFLGFYHNQIRRYPVGHYAQFDEFVTTRKFQTAAYSNSSVELQQSKALNNRFDILRTLLRKWSRLWRIYAMAVIRRV